MKNLLRITSLILLVALLGSCENPIRLETKIHYDGRLDKTIILEKTDSAGVVQNIFGVNEAKGWSLDLSRDSATRGDKNYRLEFKRSFATAEEANKELDSESDSLFRVKASFQKSFRWFYTYIRYEETIRPIDRFKLISADDYFTPEDRSFLNRLPGEGADITMADSSFLESLNDRIFKYYANRGLYFEQMDVLKKYITKNNLAPQWLDTLNKHEDYIYESINKDDSDDEGLKGDPKFAFMMADSLGIPLTQTAEKEFDELSKDLNQRIRFMNYAQYGKYTIVFDMPWTVTKTNADSVAGNKLFWRPIVTKFAIQDYTVFAESRKLNVWVVILSAIIIVVTSYSFRRRKAIL